MSRRSTPNKRQKRNTLEDGTDPHLVDLSVDLACLTGESDTADTPLMLLSSRRIINSLFSCLYRHSHIQWKDLFLNERSKLRLDEKSKEKRMILNRLISACSETTSHFQEQADALIEKMKCQMSDPIDPEQDFHTHLRLYDQVEAWKQAQSKRRLFFSDNNQLCTLLTLQRLMTDEFIRLIKPLHQNPNCIQPDDQTALTELLEHALIIVAEPSGIDCVAATKYEIVDKKFLAKIKTRILCLLDPTRIEGDCKVSSVDVTLELKEKLFGDNGDKQTSLQWKYRTVTTIKGAKRTVQYVEFEENDFLTLTKLNLKGKPLYNKVPITLTSQFFGLCSHAKYYPKYLAKVFIAELGQMHPIIDPTTHITVLKEYIYQFHQRVTGVEAKRHTQEFIEEELHAFYESCEQSASSPLTPVLILSWNIYENILTKLFTQIRYLGNHLVLVLMYYDNLFRGISSDRNDEAITPNTFSGLQIMFRFEVFQMQEPTNKPNIILMKYDGTLSRSFITHDYVINIISECCCTAGTTPENPLQTVNGDLILHIPTFRWYYDSGLHRNNLIQADSHTIFHPTNVLPQHTIRNSPDEPLTFTDQLNVTRSFHLSGQLTGNTDSINRVITNLTEYFSQLCRNENILGTLSPILTPPEAVVFDTTQMAFLNNFLLPNGFDEFFQ